MRRIVKSIAEWVDVLSNRISFRVDEAGQTFVKDASALGRQVATGVTVSADAAAPEAGARTLVMENAETAAIANEMAAALAPGESHRSRRGASSVGHRYRHAVFARLKHAVNAGGSLRRRGLPHERRKGGSRVAPTLRDAAFAGIAIGLTVCALFLAATHRLTVGAGSSVGVGAGTEQSGKQVSVAPFSEGPIVRAAVAETALITPPFSTLAWVGGTYQTRTDASTAARDFSHSGVPAYVARNGQWYVLFGPTLARGGPFTVTLQRAEVPYYYRLWQVPSVTLPVPGHSKAQVSAIEQVVVADVEALEGMIAQTSGVADPQLSEWINQSAQGATVLRGRSFAQLGSLGKAFSEFHAAVRRAEKNFANPVAAPGGENAATSALGAAMAAYSTFAGAESTLQN